MTTLDCKVTLIEFRPDDDWQHIAIIDDGRCRGCRDKPCLTVCPSGVFRWDRQPGHPVAVLYRRCVECGACRLACGDGNIAFDFPHGGYGVVFHQG